MSTVVESRRRAAKRCRLDGIGLASRNNENRRRFSAYLVYVDVFQLCFEAVCLGSGSAGAAWFVFTACLLLSGHVTPERRLDFGRGVT